MWRPQGIQDALKFERMCALGGGGSVVCGHAYAVSVTGVSVPTKGEASLSHLKSGLRLHRGLIPTPLHSSGWEVLSQVIQPPEVGRGCPMGPGRGDTELGEPWGRWGTQPRGRVLEVSLTSCPESTPASRPLSAPHITLAAFAMMEELMGKGSTSFTHHLRDAFNLPAHGLSSRTPSSPNGCEGAPGSIFPAGKCFLLT